MRCLVFVFIVVFDLVLRTAILRTAILFVVHFVVRLFLLIVFHRFFTSLFSFLNLSFS